MPGRIPATSILISALLLAGRAGIVRAQVKPAADSAALYNQGDRLATQADSLKRTNDAGRRKAIALLAQAVPLFSRSRARWEVMDAWLTTGQIYRELHRADTSLVYLRRALPIAKEIGDDPDQVTILHSVGLAFADMNHPDSALAWYRQGLTIALDRDDTVAVGTIAHGMGEAHQAMARPDSAGFYYRSAFALLSAAGHRTEGANSLDNLGNMFLDLGQADSALFYGERVLAIRRALGDSLMEATALHNIAGIFATIGLPDSALAYYRLALPMEQRNKDRRAEAVTLQNIGIVFDDMDRMDSALAYELRAFRIVRDLGDRTHQGSLYLAIGALFSELGSQDSARMAYDGALQVARENGDRIVEALTLSNIGRLYWDTFNADSAMHYARRALAIQEAAGARGDAANSLKYIGDAFRVTRKLDSAAIYYERSANLSATLSSQSGNDFNQLHFNEKSIDTYSLWALTWLDRAHAGEGVPATFAALAASERGRAQALLRLMGTKRADRPGTDLPAEGKELARRTLMSAAGALVYHVAGDTLITWLALKDGGIYASEQTVPIGRLDTLVAALRFSIAQEDAMVERSGRITRGGSPSLDPLDRALLSSSVMARAKADTGRSVRAALSALLLPPDIASHLPASGELIVIPHGGLGLVPFGLLRAGTDSLNVGDRFALRYGPSLTAIAEAESRPGLAAGGNRAQQLAPALIVGDPVMPAPFTLDRERYMFDPLPGARIEGKAVADSLGASQWLSGAAATESAVRAAIPTARLIHLATHGLVYSSDAHSRLSFVALAPDATHDGHLSVAKIVDSLTFKAELVVLSACQTAVGNVKSAEGTLGLQRAVLAKGARSVLVSLWNVNDESTLFLIQRFYHHWLHDGNVSKAEALRLAQADVRAESRVTPAHRAWADPMYWAAFQLVGAP